MITNAISIGTRLWQASQGTGVAGFATKYWDEGLKLLQTSVKLGTLNKLEAAGTAITVGTLVADSLNGMSEGGTGDFFTGFADLSQDQFSEEGNGISGSRNGRIGKLMQNAALLGASLIPKGTLAAKLGVNGVKALYKGIAGWQLASVASDWTWDDHGGLVEDTTDTVVGLASAARFAKLLTTVV